MTPVAARHGEGAQSRHKCSACYKQYKKKEHLIEHMRISHHSVHDPKCVVCRKHCKSLESVREHLTGPLPKGQCAKIFATNGCEICLSVFDSSDNLKMHKDSCRMSPAYYPPEMEISDSSMEIDNDQATQVIAMDCEMVGGGSDGSLDLCARVCLIDENEKVILHCYVKPLIPVTNYRYELTGIAEDNLVDATPLMEVTKKVEEILYNGEALWRARLKGGKARILVGHDLCHDLDCLQMDYPKHLIRDTAKYRPLMRTNLISHSLKYLTQTYLGYEIQSSIHDPYEDCVAALRLYKRMRSQIHQENTFSPFRTSNENDNPNKVNNFDPRRQKELEKMSPDDLLEISVSSYKCWCLDTRRTDSEVGMSPSP